MLNKVWAQVATGAAVFVSLSGSALAVDVNAGPIWNQGDAQGKCPSVCSNAKMTWNGNWTTTVPGQMSVCGCNPPAQPAATPVPAQAATPPAQAPKPMMPPAQPQMPQGQPPMQPFAFKPTNNPCADADTLGKSIAEMEAKFKTSNNPAEKQQLQQHMSQANGIVGAAKAACDRQKSAQPGKPDTPPQAQPMPPQGQPMMPPAQPQMPQGQPPAAQSGAQGPANGPCQAAAAMEKSLAEMFARYNTLTSNKSAGEKQQLKGQIAQTTEHMNAAKAACAKQPPAIPPCAKQVEAQAKLVGDMHAKYNTLTSNKQAGEKQQLKAAIINEQAKLDQMKATCH